MPRKKQSLAEIFCQAEGEAIPGNVQILSSQNGARRIAFADGSIAAEIGHNVWEGLGAGKRSVALLGIRRYEKGGVFPSLDNHAIIRFMVMWPNAERISRELVAIVFDNPTRIALIDPAKLGFEDFSPAPVGSEYDVRYYEPKLRAWIDADKTLRRLTAYATIADIEDAARAREAEAFALEDDDLAQAS